MNRDSQSTRATRHPHVSVQQQRHLEQRQRNRNNQTFVTRNMKGRGKAYFLLRKSRIRRGKYEFYCTRCVAIGGNLCSSVAQHQCCVTAMADMCQSLPVMAALHWFQHSAVYCPQMKQCYHTLHMDYGLRLRWHTAAGVVYSSPAGYVTWSTYGFQSR